MESEELENPDLKESYFLKVKNYVTLKTLHLKCVRYTNIEETRLISGSQV